MWVMLSLGERAGVRANLKQNEIEKENRVKARPHPYPLPWGEGTAFGGLFDDSCVSLAVADCWPCFQERVWLPERWTTILPLLGERAGVRASVRGKSHT